MRQRLTLPPTCAIALLTLCSAIPLSASAQVFDTQFNAMIMNQNLGATTTRSRNIDEIKHQERERQQRSDQNNAAPAPRATGNIAAQTENAVFEALRPEYQRRRSAQGKPQADAWMQTAASSVGQQVGALHDQYQQRVQRDGQQSADRWYIAQARAISQRHVTASR